MTATTNDNTAQIEPAVLIEQVGPVRRLIMNRPDTRNALSKELMAELADELDKANNDPETRVIVLAANGTVFCSGHNLKELTDHRGDSDRGKHYFAQMVRTGAALMQTIVNIPKIVIAEVQGPATAAGTQLVATCDLAICVNEATFSTPGVNIGLFCSTSMVALTRTMTRKNAMEMLVTGEEIDAHTAKAWGLVNRVVPKEYLRIVVDKYANEIAAKSPQALKYGKEAFYRQADMNLSDAYDLAAYVMTENMLASDSEIGIEAFLDKRKPDWGNQS